MRIRRRNVKRQLVRVAALNSRLEPQVKTVEARATKLLAARRGNVPMATARKGALMATREVRM